MANELAHKTEEAIKAIDHLMYSSPHESTEEVVTKKYYAEILMDYIANTIEVVRCKECIYHSECAFTEWLGRNGNGYCSCGERRHTDVDTEHTEKAR